MPNWCQNYLGVAGTLPRVRQFMEAAKSESQSISFQQLFPASMSKEIVKAGPFVRIEGESVHETALRWGMADHEHPAWYLDRIEKWGVKWEAAMYPMPDSISLRTSGNIQLDESIEDDIEDGEEVVAVFHFDTPWAEPARLFDKVSKDFPDLKFRLKWLTEGPETKGISEWVGGKKTRDESSDWEALDCLDWK
jgi:hypothetical protein